MESPLSNQTTTDSSFSSTNVLLNIIYSHRIINASSSLKLSLVEVCLILLRNLQIT